MGGAILESTSFDTESLLLERLDYEAQLFAIRSLLFRQERADQELEVNIDRVEKFATVARGRDNEDAVAAWVDLLHRSCFQDAAHSMAAVGMFAPFIESVFRHAFPDTFLKKRYRRISLAKKVMKLVDEVRIREHMPDDLELTLSAPFAYRNKMFHCGFEWTSEDLKTFDRELENSCWPSDWFQVATSDGEPWMFYMSPKFIDHCLNMIEQVIKGIKDFEKGSPDFPIRQEAPEILT